MEDKRILGLTEDVMVYSETKSKKVLARIDTGATRSSIDIKLAAELGLGPILETRQVKSSLGTDLRPIVRAKIEIAGKELESTFTLADRDHMNYKILIGQNILKEGFLIDPLKKR
ncbi:ATP-dependent zinc protease [Candidatus Woesearchaeota archaeon]|nr:ATP-dependent zinc protease [Candidatus Woesearchaeota archaeon]